jgi:hypothetical protein
MVIEQADPGDPRSCWLSWNLARPIGSPLTFTKARREYRHVSESPGKGNKAGERNVISSFQIAQSLGFNGELRQWEHLLLSER